MIVESPSDIATIAPTPSTDVAPLQSGSSALTKVSPPATFFPSITTGIRKIINSYNTDKSRLYKDLKTKKWVVKPQLLKKDSPKLSLVGTVKLHGVHIDMVFDQPTSTTFRIQSRNVASLDASNDIFNIAATLRSPAHQVAICGIRDNILVTFAALNPGITIDETKPLIIAGEWVGPGIFKGVALARFPARALVLLNFKINGAWVPSIAPYEDIHSQDLSIFNIAWGGFFDVELLVDKAEACFAEVEKLTLEVEKECPFALVTSRRFGEELRGVGEGIIWRLASPANTVEVSERYWAKTKGPDHSDTSNEMLPATFNADAKATAKAFAAYAVTETRMEKKWIDVVELSKGKVDLAQTGNFMQLLQKDVEKEESEEMKRLEINVIEMRKEIGVLGKAWFQAKLKTERSLW